MLYLVECQTRDENSPQIITKEKKRNYIAPYPEGTEAQSRNDAIQIVISALCKDTSDEERQEVTIEGTTYFNFYAKPKKWERYPTPMSSNDINEAYEEELLNALTEKGIEADICMDGIRVKTGVDVWVVDIREAHEDYAYMFLYHKNHWNADNVSESRIPGFHKQLSGNYSIQEIIEYMTGHENKWKPKNNCRRNRKYSNGRNYGKRR